MSFQAPPSYVESDAAAKACQGAAGYSADKAPDLLLDALGSLLYQARLTHGLEARRIWSENKDIVEASTRLYRDAREGPCPDRGLILCAFMQMIKLARFSFELSDAKYTRINADRLEKCEKALIEIFTTGIL